MNEFISVPLQLNEAFLDLFVLPVLGAFAALLILVSLGPRLESKFLTLFLAAGVFVAGFVCLFYFSGVEQQENLEKVDSALGELGLERLEDDQTFKYETVRFEVYSPGSDCDVVVNLQDDMLRTDGSGRIADPFEIDRLSVLDVSSAEDLVAFVEQEVNGVVSSGVSEAEFVAFESRQPLYLIVESDDGSQPFQIKVYFEDGEIVMRR